MAITLMAKGTATMDTMVTETVTTTMVTETATIIMDIITVPPVITTTDIIVKQPKLSSYS